MIAGGSEAAICAMGVGGFGALRALSTRNDDPAHGEPAVRQGSRRLRARRRRRHAGARRARVRPAARRADLRRDGRLRHVGRRVSHDGAVRRRRRRVSRDAGGARVGGHQAGRTSTTSTPTARRRRTTIASRRMAIKRAFGDHAPQAGGVVDQVDDRATCSAPPAGSRPASPRWPCTIRRCRRRSTSTARRGLDLDYVPDTCRARCRFATRCRTRSASAAPTARCCSRSSRSRRDGHGSTEARRRCSDCRRY